jgi:hypothetical protein
VIAGAPERPLILGEIDHLRVLLVTVPNPGFGKFDALLREDLRAQAKQKEEDGKYFRADQHAGDLLYQRQ